jgi:predicted DNA-binding transcriptional regulator AlpA
MKEKLGRVVPLPQPEVMLVDRGYFRAALTATDNQVTYLEETDPDFPRAVRLGRAFNSSKRWVKDEADAYMRKRIASRDGEQLRVSNTSAVMHEQKRAKALRRSRGTILPPPTESA